MTRSRQEIRAEETKQAILLAAQQLFAVRGYDSVTMREIAKAAGCSHTTIYLYYKDKEALLHQLSMEPLTALQEQLKSITLIQDLPAVGRLKSFSLTFIQFCLLNRNMYSLFFMAKSSRVDEQEPALEVQKIRNNLFALMRQGVQDYVGDQIDEEQLLAYTRIYFFLLNGVITTYLQSTESCEQLMERLTPTFELAIDVMLSGFTENLHSEKTSDGRG
ncbi:TetR/AcrR family transcriptional regulator [Brevibacillus ginsengisoli]|uniref:TetR/AcrR family transcriptional regulator n=1 Tax=Brevibacillus ginsengisoli TaxID=363854 RepID=UPI003CEBA8EE